MDMFFFLVGGLITSAKTGVVATSAAAQIVGSANLSLPSELRYKVTNFISLPQKKSDIIFTRFFKSCTITHDNAR